MLGARKLLVIMVLALAMIPAAGHATPQPPALCQSAGWGSEITTGEAGVTNYSVAFGGSTVCDSFAVVMSLTAELWTSGDTLRVQPSCGVVLGNQNVAQSTGVCTAYNVTRGIYDVLTTTVFKDSYDNKQYTNVSHTIVPVI